MKQNRSRTDEEKRKREGRQMKNIKKEGRKEGKW